MTPHKEAVDTKRNTLPSHCPQYVISLWRVPKKSQMSSLCVKSPNYGVIVDYIGRVLGGAMDIFGQFVSGEPRCPILTAANHGRKGKSEISRHFLFFYVKLCLLLVMNCDAILLGLTSTTCQKAGLTARPSFVRLPHPVYLWPPDQHVPSPSSPSAAALRIWQPRLVPPTYAS